MALVIRHALEVYEITNNVIDDKRVRDFFLMANPFQPIAILSIYLLFVLKWGPMLMAGRKPYGLHNVIKFYNLLQVAICSYITAVSLYHSFGQGYSWICEPIDFSNNYHAVELIKVSHLYFMTKVIDLIDTVFFVLKKKQTHVTFLHVYHHAGMVALSWIGVKYVAGGQSIFMGTLNSFVHVVMYFYYYLTSVDNKYKQSVWKKYITQLQMVQFGLMALHWLALLLSPPCGYPKFISFFMLPQNFFIFVLFYDFYRKAYREKPQIANSNGAKLREKEISSTGGFKQGEKVNGKSNGLNYEKTVID